MTWTDYDYTKPVAPVKAHDKALSGWTLSVALLEGSYVIHRLLCHIAWLERKLAHDGD